MATQAVTALRFKDLVIKVAEFLGIASYGSDGTGIAAVPTDTHDLDLCKRIVNDGYRRFIADSVDPRTNRRWQWRFLNRYFELTLVATATGQNVNANAGRYRMPWYFSGSVFRDWEFSSDTYSHSIRITSESEVQKLLSATDDTTGPPQLCAFRRMSVDDIKKPADQADRLWEVIFWPKPSESLVINIMLRAYPSGLQDLDDFHFAGPEHDMTIEAACMAQAELDKQDRLGAQASNYERMLAQSIVIDQQTAPRSLGFNTDSGEGPPLARHAGYTGVDTYNGAAIDAAT